MKTGIYATALLLLASLHLQAADIMVFAAASLTNALTEIKQSYEAQSSNKILFNFGASGTLGRQVQEGAPADLFISADEARVDALEKLNLLENATRLNLLSNTLVVVVPIDDKVAFTSIQDLAAPRFKRVALSDPQLVPVGTYSKQYLTQLNLWDAINDRLVFTDNVRATLAAVEAGNADAGMVYRTDALISKRVRIAWSVPLEEGPKILYPFVVVKACKNPEGARDFLQYLQSPSACTIFEKQGFLVLTKP
ncbi:MAG: molybdate ABC transporter substrate-binding protein [Verrucomicrobiota bacterium]|nr:molybdate ABC transporter substrate-binding protein [Verrucomicrobiota bacterium]